MQRPGTRFSSYRNRTDTSYLRKFGFNPAMAKDTAEDIYDLSGNYAGFLTAAEALDVVSTSAEDAAAGSGCAVVTISYQDGDNTEITEDVTLTGDTPVALAENGMRCYRIKCKTPGSTSASSSLAPVNAGVITVATVAGGTPLATVQASLGQTQMTIWTVPAGERFYLTKWVADVISTTAAVRVQMQLRVREPSGCWRVIDNKGMTENQGIDEDYNPAAEWNGWAAGTDIIVRGTADVASAICSSSFQGVRETVG